MTEQTQSTASLLASIAALLNAIAWPSVVVWFLVAHRVRIALLLRVLIRKLSTAKKLKVGQLEMEAFEDELKDAVNDAGSEAEPLDAPKAVSERQVQAAKVLAKRVEAAPIPRAQVLDSVRRQIYDLAAEYETARTALPGGPMRTRKMNEIAAGMRTLAFAALPLRTELTRSDSVGRRLAAICILQVEPRPRYFRWLIERVKVEKQAFVLYQAAVAVLEFVKKKLYISPEDTRESIADAIRVVSAYSGGPPDSNTIDALNEALALVG